MRFRTVHVSTKGDRDARIEPDYEATQGERIRTLVEKRAVLLVLNPLQSRFWNREHESGTKGLLL